MTIPNEDYTDAAVQPEAVRGWLEPAQADSGPWCWRWLLVAETTKWEQGGIYASIGPDPSGARR